MPNLRFGLIAAAVGLLVTTAIAQIPDHPVITEVYTDPPGVDDGPVARDPSNPHQEYIELYLPPGNGPLRADLNKDAVNLTFYEVEGDASSSGVELVNYRFDLPTFDLDLSNGLTSGAVARPGSGVVVLAWVDYVGDPPTDLAGTSATRVALVNGGITGTGGDYVLVAINGHHFSGTTNFPVLGGESLIHLPSEATSGVIQNGSAAYLLVNRDDPDYVELYDDKDTAHVPPLSNADPALASGNVLRTSSFLDGFAANDDSAFAVDQQPPQVCNDTPDQCDDLQTVLPEGGAFSLLVCQVPEEDTSRITPAVGNGYARRFVDVPKTTEDPVEPDDPIADATMAYRLIRNSGPFYPTPGSAAMTISAPKLSVAQSQEQHFMVLTDTIGRPGILAANTGGSYNIDIAASGGTSSNALVATFATGFVDADVPGQTFSFPSVAVTPGPSGTDGMTASATITVSATNSSGGDPAVLNAAQPVTVTATILDPTTGLAANGQAFQTTVFVAIQAIEEDPFVANEFRGSDVGAFLAAQPDPAALETLGNSPLLLDAGLDISIPGNINAVELPALGEECTNWIDPPGPIGRLSFSQTVLNSAEVQSGATTYDESLAVDINCGTIVTRVRARAFNHPDLKTFGGSFIPSEVVHFADANGTVGNPRSGLSNATSLRSFELVLVDTNLNPFTGTLETGLTDDFGLIVEVLETEPGSPVVPGEFVFLSFSGGLQGADIDPLVGSSGNILLQLFFLDLDNLHSELGIRSLERLFVVDGSGSGVIDMVEVFTLNPVSGAVTNVSAADPPANGSLWRSRQNIVRLTFDQDITLPPPGAVMIQPLQSGGAFGADVSSGFTFTIENDGGTNPRILRILENDPPVLAHRTWYAIRNAGGWAGIANFNLHYVVQVGDANGDGQVVNLDVGVINPAIPNFDSGDHDRRDIDGDSTILNADVSTCNARIPSFAVPKPSGH